MTFTEKLKNQLVNLQDLLERRAASTKLSGDMKAEATRMMSTIKPILDGLADDTNYRDYTTSVVRSGFIALSNAESMMSKQV